MLSSPRSKPTAFKISLGSLTHGISPTEKALYSLRIFPISKRYSCNLGPQAKYLLPSWNSSPGWVIGASGRPGVLLMKLITSHLTTNKQNKNYQKCCNSSPETIDSFVKPKSNNFMDLRSNSWIFPVQIWLLRSKEV